MWQILRFAIVGIAATAVHSIVALAYLASTDGSALAANSFGFSVAVFVSLIGNMIWVFPQAGRTSAHIARFLTVALISLAVTCAISALFDRLRIEPMLSLPAVLMIAPCISYCGNRFWAFAR